MSAVTSPTVPSRQETLASTFSDDAVPDVDPSSVRNVYILNWMPFPHCDLTNEVRWLDCWAACRKTSGVEARCGLHRGVHRGGGEDPQGPSKGV